jgi:hypothetical protein
MGLRKHRKRILISLSFLLLAPLFLIAAWFAMIIFNPFHTHEHCIKNAGLALRIYATDHNGKFPSHTNGFGNALLLLAVEGNLGDTNNNYKFAVGPITGPGDNGAIFKQALKSGQPIPESQCSRIYIQGLSETNNPNIAILFDKNSTPGGDHFRRPWGPRLRELSLLDGSMQTVLDKDWPRFATNQIKLLIDEGINPATAAHYYQIR